MRGYYERASRTTAKRLVEEYGQSLIGRRVRTSQFGWWPGGIARVTRIAPDPGAPEILFEVDASDNQAVKAAINKGEIEDAVVGVFDNEEVELLP